MLDYIVAPVTEHEPFTAFLNYTIKIGIEIGDLNQNVDLGFSFYKSPEVATRASVYFTHRAICS